MFPAEQPIEGPERWLATEIGIWFAEAADSLDLVGEPALVLDTHLLAEGRRQGDGRCDLCPRRVAVTDGLDGALAARKRLQIIEVRSFPGADAKAHRKHSCAPPLMKIGGALQLVSSLPEVRRAREHDDDRCLAQPRVRHRIDVAPRFGARAAPHPDPT